MSDNSKLSNSLSILQLGELDKEGNLFLLRSGELTPAGCPFNENHCGNWCALFGEPETEHEIEATMAGVKTNETGNTRLSICKKDFIFAEFRDNRGDD